MALVLLLLLDDADREVLVLLPVDLAALALDDLGALERERVVLVRLALHLVVLRQDLVREVVVLLEEELQHEALKRDDKKLVNERMTKSRLKHIREVGQTIGSFDR